MVDNLYFNIIFVFILIKIKKNEKKLLHALRSVLQKMKNSCKKILQMVVVKQKYSRGREGQNNLCSCLTKNQIINNSRFLGNQVGKQFGVFGVFFWPQVQVILLSQNNNQ
eukprot:TRINITY_DN12181_c9_g1_i2.p3 TRINITY_DN12181_c9_g1~~TRINITY_DN12181_c9_g1_i2.p3  ORF type:complete len:121 (+),score=7.17 TRINITY_DN12181_c9_g1_i2:36-365(+)